MQIQMSKASARVQSKVLLWSQREQAESDTNTRSLRVSEPQVLIQIYCQFYNFCSVKQQRWVEVFAQRGVNQRRITQQI